MGGAAMGVFGCFAMTRSYFAMVYCAIGHNSLDEQYPAINQNRFEIN